MTSPMHREGAWGAAVSALMLALVLPRLGGSCLWSDEAVTGLLGNEILRVGLPRGAVHGVPLPVWSLTGAENWKNGLWYWDGWLQAYLSAAGQAIFGSTALGARFFHAVAGAFIPWAAYPLFREMPGRRGVAEAATLLTGLSVPLLILTRQAHYFAVGSLLTVLTLRAYVWALGSRPRSEAALVLWATLLFHANFVWFGLVGLAIGGHLLATRPSRRVVKRLGFAAGAVAVLTGPFALWAHIWSRNFAPGGPFPLDPYIFLSQLRHYLLELNLHGAPAVLLFVGGAASAGLRRPLIAGACLVGAVVFPLVVSGPATVVTLWAFAAVVILFGLFGLGVALKRVLGPPRGDDRMPEVLVALVVGAFVLFAPRVAPYPWFRYMTPLLPLLAFLLAASVFAIFGRTWLAWTVTALLLVTNAASVLPVRWASSRVFLPGIIAAGRSPETLAQTPVPAWTRAPNLYVALFHVGWEPEGPPRLDPRSPLADYVDEITHPYQGPIDAIVGYILPRKRADDRFYVVYGAYPIAFHTGIPPSPFQPLAEPPRWVIPRAAWPGDRKMARDWIGARAYREVVLPAVDTVYQNREEPDLHRFRTAREGPRVSLWERVDPGIPRGP